MPLVHHELCFGCGRSNLFGLLLDAQRAEGGTVSGRWFVKQDHQGPVPGQLHPGLVACALLEAISLVSGPDRAPESLEFELDHGAPAAVGSFCQIEAGVAEEGQGRATASVDGRLVGALRCSFASPTPGKGSV